MSHVWRISRIDVPGDPVAEVVLGNMRGLALPVARAPDGSTTLMHDARWRFMR